MSYEPTAGSESDRNSASRPGSSQTRSGEAGVTEQISEFMDQVKGSGTEAFETVRQEAQKAAADQKESSAQRLRAVARAIDRAAGELDQEMPVAAKYVRRTAAQVEQLSHSLSKRSFDEIADAFANFARRQPSMVLGAGVLAGFALTRLVKGAASRHHEEVLRTGSSFRSQAAQERREPGETHEAPALQPVGEQ